MKREKTQSTAFRWCTHFLTNLSIFQGMLEKGFIQYVGLDNMENSLSLTDLLRTQLTNKRDP